MQINARLGRSRDHAAPPPETAMKILLPVDGSDFTKRMLAYIAAHDELLGKGHQFVALTVVLPLPGHATRFIDHRTLDDYYSGQAESALAPVKAFAEQNGWTVTLKHVVGSPDSAIAAFAAAERVDLIVMGSHGHSALGNMVLGSVANGVLARCKVPVLLVR
jgi:nucleotide-binding universal stress UspA family protein